MSFSKNKISSSRISSDIKWYLRTNPTTKDIHERFETDRAIPVADGQIGVREGSAVVGDAFPGGEFTIHMYEPISIALKKESHVDMLSLAVEHAFS